MKFDLNEVSALLHVHEKAMGHPKLKPIADQAMKALEQFAEESAPAPATLAPAAEPVPEKEPESEDKPTTTSSAPVRRL